MGRTLSKSAADSTMDLIRYVLRKTFLFTRGEAGVRHHPQAEQVYYSLGDSVSVTSLSASPKVVPWPFYWILLRRPPVASEVYISRRYPSDVPIANGCA